MLSPTGVNNVNHDAEVKMYPNPATNTIYFESPVEVNVTICSMDGKTVLAGKGAKELNISALANGLYMVTVSDNSGNRLMIEKLVKE